MKSPPLREIWKSYNSPSDDKIHKSPVMVANNPLIWLEFYGKSYEDLRAESVNSLKQLWSRLNLLSSRVGKIKDLIEQLQRYRRMNRPSKLPTCISIFSKPLELKFQIKTLILPIVSLPELPLLALDQLPANYF